MKKHILHVKFRYTFAERWEDKDADYDVVLDHWPTNTDMLAACAIANSYEAEEVRINIDEHDQGHYYSKYQFENIELVK